MIAEDGMFSDGWRTALPTPAQTRDGQRIHVVAGLVTTDTGLLTALQVGEDGHTAMMSHSDDLRLIARLRYLVGKRIQEER